jgi:PAS domain S-box-containing protein
MAAGRAGEMAASSNPRTISDWSRKAQYALALGAIVAAVGVRLALMPALGHRFPFFTIFVVLLPLAFFVRLGPLLAATVVGTLASMYFFLEPVRTLRVASADRLQIGLFLTSVGLLITLSLLSRRSRDRLLRADAMLRAFVDDSPTSKWVTDPQGRIVYANRAMGDSIGKPVDEILGHTHAEILPPGIANAASEHVRNVRETGRPVTTLERIDGDGGDGRIMEWRRFPLRLGDSDTLFVAGMANDITEKWKTEAALRLSEAALRTKEHELETIISLTPFMMTRCTRDLRYRFVSQAYARMIGRAQHEVTGQPIGEIMGHNGLSTIMPYIERVLAGETVAYESPVEFEGLGMRYLSVVYTPDRNESGDVIGWVGSIVDQTDIRKSQSELAAALKERECLLESERAARIEAEQATRVKDEFLATLSHELRTPLNAILGWIRLIEKNPEDTTLLHDGIPIIARNAKVQMDLIGDLLDTSRIISGKIRLDLKPLDLGEVVNAAVETVRPVAESRAIRIEGTVERFNEPVLGDENRVQQIVWNLVSNAVKFTPGGGRIDVTVQKNGSLARIVVRDTGEGINAAFLPHLFERFRQADATASRRFVGLGLGLAIVKHLVELHGGTVRAHSDGEGHGSAFTVELPLAQLAAEAKISKAAPVYVPEVVDLSGVSVLAVEDHGDSLDLLKRVLEERRARVLIATSADDALAIVRDKRPDIVISDIAMPGKDGYDMIRELRKSNDDTPAIAVTAFARTEDVTRAIQAGYQAHVSKPVDETALVAAVSAYARCRIKPAPSSHHASAVQGSRAGRNRRRGDAAAPPPSISD